jgi:hypothetical protein
MSWKQEERVKEHSVLLEKLNNMEYLIPDWYWCLSPFLHPKSGQKYIEAIHRERRALVEKRSKIAAILGLIL